MLKSIAKVAPVRTRLAAALSAFVLLLAAEVGQAQVNGLFGNRVGGVSIDAAGMVSPPEKSARIPMRDMLRKLHAAPAAELKQAAEMRMFSLKSLEAAIKNSGATTVEKLPDDLRFLAGIQRIQYVLIYPEENDIVLAGPGEGWMVNEEGNVVGQTTGRPVLRLEDLMVALRTVDAARQGGLSCSIDPTAEGRQRYEEVVAKRNGGGGLTPAMLKRAFGPQQITVTGAPADSHFARILVSSDYHMKRIGMNLEPSQVKGLPSYLEMLKRDAAEENPTPRWWMACHYEPLGRSEDGLAFELRGPGVKCMAEDEVVDAQGRVAGTGSANPTAQKWADLMTQHYEELSAKEASFGELRNLMDLCVVAALIAKEQLLAKAHCELPALMSPTTGLSYEPLHAPKTVDTICSTVKRGNELIVMTGGVQIASWQVADRTEASPGLARIQQRAKPSSTSSAWWNAAR